VSYEKEFGHTCVPQKYTKNPPLGRWVGSQRSNYRKFQNGNALCGITAAKIQLLKNIGFKWDVNIIQNNSSDSQYKDLLSYENDIGGTRVPQQFAEIHLKEAGVTRKEEIVQKTQNGESSCGKIKVMEFSC